MIDSLHTACTDAGGSCCWDDVKDMPFRKVVELLATNGIRFIYTRTAAITTVEAEALEINRIIEYLMDSHNLKMVINNNGK